jgi:hypothetical protein
MPNAISTETVDVSPPPETDDIVLASFNSSTDDSNRKRFLDPGYVLRPPSRAVGARSG